MKEKLTIKAGRRRARLADYSVKRVSQQAYRRRKINRICKRGSFEIDWK